MRIAVIGGGIAGIAAARALARFGHQTTIFERSESPGGVWTVAYPEVRLQNIASHYRLADFPWPFEPDLHPTADQILRYLRAAIERFDLDVRTRHEVVAMHEEPAGWRLELRTPSGDASERFDHVVVATGHFTGPPQPIELAGRERFRGRVIVDRDVHDLDVLARKRVAVVGFGKSAVDLATFAAQRGSVVHHVFRTPRWLLPRVLFGVHSAHVVFTRLSTGMIPAWVQPNGVQRLLHARLRPLVAAFWGGLAMAMRLQYGLYPFHLDPGARRRLRRLLPERSVPAEMRSAVALAPDKYFPLVAKGKIEPLRGQPVGFSEDALRLADGREIPCDLVVLSLGYATMRFPFLPERYRALLEAEPDGPQLYRHLLHPQIPRLSFAGCNQSLLFVPGVEVSMLWLGALLQGDLALPSVAEMESQIEEVRRWKQAHVLFDSSRGTAVNTRFHQYADVMLRDLGLSPWRKRNLLAEVLVAYTAADYDGLFDEYQARRADAPRPRRPLPLAT
jgi:dimethylaniline monooxygenase (N-oxide forming)